MENDRRTNIARAYCKITRPWTSKGLVAPAVSVIEITRTAGVKNPAVVANELANRGIVFGENDQNRKLILQNKDGQNIEDFQEEARRIAPYKRAVNQADYRSRAPGGSPVVRRRINKRSLERKLLQLGKGKLKVEVENYDENKERNKQRQETKKRLEIRWAGKPSTEIDPVIIRTEEAFSFIKRISERKGLVNEDELFSRLRFNMETGNPQTILAIWGPPYEGQTKGYQNVFDCESPEEEMASSIAKVISQLNSSINTRLLILYADYYGTGINDIPKDEVESYGRQIMSRFEGIGEFICWSELKNQNLTDYYSLGDKLPETAIMPIEDEVKRALVMQGKLGNVVTDSQAWRLAMMYKRERIIEGKMLGEGFVWRGIIYDNIIKLGTAPSRMNDEPYEPELPRFYVSEMPRAVWNTPR